VVGNVKDDGWDTKERKTRGRSRKKKEKEKKQGIQVFLSLFFSGTINGW
jgi:hypothetical protein